MDSVLLRLLSALVLHQVCCRLPLHAHTLLCHSMGTLLLAPILSSDAILRILVHSLVIHRAQLGPKELIALEGRIERGTGI